MSTFEERYHALQKRERAKRAVMVAACAVAIVVLAVFATVVFRML